LVVVAVVQMLFMLLTQIPLAVAVRVDFFTIQQQFFHLEH
jgi:hypothetical protein